MTFKKLYPLFQDEKSEFQTDNGFAQGCLANGSQSGARTSLSSLSKILPMPQDTWKVVLTKTW